LRSHSQPKPRRNLRSRYANMMGSIHPRSNRPGSSDSARSAARRTRSSSTTSRLSFTNPTAPYQDSDQGRLGSGFSILKPEVPRSQIPQAAFPKILALPPWLQDTITELDGSHPLRAVFPTLHDASDTGALNHPLENSPDSPITRHAHHNDANWAFRFPPTPRIHPSRPRQPDSDTSSDGPQPASTYQPLHHNNSLLHLRSVSPTNTPFVGAVSQPEGVFPAAANSDSSSSAPTNVANTTHIPGLNTTPLSASPLNCHPPHLISPAPRPNAEYDGIFRCNLLRPDSATALPPSQPFIFERPTQVYFDSPIEDPINSDPWEPEDHDPFKLDPEECKNLNFKWAPFDLQTGIRGEPTAGEPEISARSPGADEEVLVSDGSSYDLAYPCSLLLG
jgi:hypothetical protein